MEGRGGEERGIDIGGCTFLAVRGSVDSLYVERTVFNGFTIDLDRGRGVRGRGGDEREGVRCVGLGLTPVLEL